MIYTPPNWVVVLCAISQIGFLIWLAWILIKKDSK